MLAMIEGMFVSDDSFLVFLVSFVYTFDDFFLDYG